MDGMKAGTSQGRATPRLRVAARVAAIACTLAASGGAARAATDAGPADASPRSAHAGHAASPHKAAPRQAAHPAPASGSGPVALRELRGTLLDLEARKLVRDDLRDAQRAGERAVVLIGNARLGGAEHARRGATQDALFVQVQAPQVCGSGGCSLQVFVPSPQGWRKVLDTIGSTIATDPRRHAGMADLMVNRRDRYIWAGNEYQSAQPAPQIDLHQARRAARRTT